jgi:hypothetical protein
VILECALNGLVEKIRGKEFVNIRTREIHCKWLQSMDESFHNFQ